MNGGVRRRINRLPEGSKYDRDYPRNMGYIKKPQTAQQQHKIGLLNTLLVK